MATLTPAVSSPWRGKSWATPMLLMLVVLATIASACLVGRYELGAWQIARIVLGTLFPLEADWSPTAASVVLQIRLPRVATALLAGGALALSGACYQGIFRNPLVSPFVLGISSGAGFGAALAILWSANALLIQSSAFAFAMLAVIATTALARLYQANQTLILVLSGIIVGAVFSALLSLLKYAADPEDKLPVIEFWLMGSLSGTSPEDVQKLLLIIVPATIVLLLLRWRLNVLALGDEQARALGVDVGRVRLLVLALATLLAASAVSVCGVVGWIGLVGPHIARLLVGPDHVRMLPVAFVFGGCLLTLVDTLARSLTQAEVPLGIITALVGAPLFAILLRRGSRSWL